LYFTKKETYLLTIQKQWKNYLLTANHYYSFSKEEIVEANEQAFREQYGEDVPVNIQLLEKAVTKLQNVIDWLKNTTPDYIFYT
jgi:hypothetical protein